MEIQRVLGGDVASFKEFKTALSACLRREGDRGETAERWEKGLSRQKSKNVALSTTIPKAQSTDD